MMYLVTVTLEEEVGSNKRESFEVEMYRPPRKRQLKSNWDKSLVLTAISGDRVAVHWRRIRSVQVVRQK